MCQREECRNRNDEARKKSEVTNANGEIFAAKRVSLAIWNSGNQERCGSSSATVVAGFALKKIGTDVLILDFRFCGRSVR